MLTAMMGLACNDKARINCGDYIVKAGQTLHSRVTEANLLSNFESIFEKSTI